METTPRPNYPTKTDWAAAEVAKIQRDMQAADREQAQVLALERHLADRQATPPPALSKAWASLKDGVAALDAEARMQARQLVADTFERIVVYHRGITPTETRSWGGTIDILLVVKHGATRILHIDRRTGAWRAGEEVNIPAGGLPAA